MTERHFLRKQIWRTGLKLVALAAFCVSLASADQILYWEDSVQGTSAIPSAISEAGFTGVQASDDIDFDSLLTTQTWAAVIINIGNLPLTIYDPSILEDLTSYVNGGGVLIGQDYNLATGGDSGFAELFQATAVGNDAFSVTNDHTVLFDHIGGDIELTNPGWDVYDVEYVPTGSATGYGPSGPPELGGFAVIQGSYGSGTTFLNGPLSDAYAAVYQGEQLIGNEINLGTNTIAPPQIPEPGTWILLGSAVLTLAVRRRRGNRISAS